MTDREIPRNTETARSRTYVTEEYEDRLRAIADAHASLTYEAVEDRFVEECKSNQEMMKDEAPMALIRKLAYQKTESRAPFDDEDEDEE